ncbi:hypothetical protein [Pimelobacter simplex]|uniref:hypothetical protein n=1 Tax=Nocardioides simplex TaxID=2045 RepID=UPI00214F8613|nr:hypothetical protein [Pimelobacter simplex]UUW92507.1 hypothetical protein M0M43_13765 [Pimelobacter simplex]UUW96335.1 hypothetical protein M0M48_02400 [Pimelobacter simplex]
MTRAIAAAALLTLGVLAGCGGDDGGDSDAKAVETVTATATVTVTPETFESAPDDSTSSAEEDPYAPNVGDRALKVGETRVGQSIETTLEEMKIPYPPGQYREPGPNNVFLGLRIEQCLAADAPTDIYSTYAHDWSAVAPSGSEYKDSGSSWNDWPTPRFSEYVTMIPGRCIKGWIAYEVPQGAKIASVLWRPDGVTTAEWLPR